MFRSAESKMFAHVDLVIAVSCYTLEQDFASVSCVFTIPRRFSIGFKPSELPGNVPLPQKLGTFSWHHFLASLNVYLDQLNVYSGTLSCKGDGKWHPGHHFLLPNWAGIGGSREARKQKVFQDLCDEVTCTHRPFLGNPVQLRQCLGSHFPLTSVILAGCFNLSRGGTGTFF